MANEMISKDFSKHKIADVFKNVTPTNDLASGIQGGFAVIGYRGKTWSVRSRGEEEKLMRPDGDGPRSSIDVVILSSASVLSKTWYEKGYVEGNSAPPDCWSGNSITPDPMSPKVQSSTCATCPRNVWGGRITENGKRAKECADAKRMAVVFVDELLEAEPEVMMLRVPAASLGDLASYGNEISKLGYPHYSVVTKVTFDPEESYPKFMFTATRPLNNEEGGKAIDMRDDPLIERILAQTSEAMLVEGSVTAVAPKTIIAEATPAPKIEAKATPKEAKKENGPTRTRSRVTPRKAEPPKEEIEDAMVVQEGEATDVETEVNLDEPIPEDLDDEAFDKALDAKLSAFLGGDKS